MLRVVIMNAKGGCGKTTVATNLASYCAAQGYMTALFDYDTQASSMRWLRARPPHRPFVQGVSAYQPPPEGMTRAWQLRVPEQTRYIITDTPAGYSSVAIEDRVAESDVILVPVLPSAIDIHSTADFIRDLLLIGKVRALKKPLAIVANRTRIHTRAHDKLEGFLDKLDIPVIGYIRDTQHYVRAVEEGLGVHELTESSARQDVASWTHILDWLERQGSGAAMPVPDVSLPMAASK